MTRHLKFMVLIALVTLLDSSIPSAFDTSTFNKSTQPLRILRITPCGVDVPPGRQIVFQFNRPVVPVGRMQRDASQIPITITADLANVGARPCFHNGLWRKNPTNPPAGRTRSE